MPGGNWSMKQNMQWLEQLCFSSPEWVLKLQPKKVHTPLLPLDGTVLLVLAASSENAAGGGVELIVQRGVQGVAVNGQQCTT